MPNATPFGTTDDGTAVELFTLENAHGLKATITNYGGIITSLLVPDRAGKLGDVILGFDDLRGYLSPAYRQSNPYFGAIIGRYGNRIKAGKFTIEGKSYQAGVNNGPNSLHGGKVGFNQKVWHAEFGTSAEGQTLTLQYLSKDGEEGYPGNLQITVEYTLGDDNALRIAYTATTDQATPVNLTNHAYFNLGLGVSPDVLTHEVSLAADRYTVVDAELIPTGELRLVAGTAFDFTTPHAIGERIAQVPGGYDHNWALNQAFFVLAGLLTLRGYDHNWALNQAAGPVLAAVVYDPASGRTLEVTTDQPGIQFYTGNFLDGSLEGKNGVTYGKYAGFCLETQHFPDAPNQSAFPNTVLGPGEMLHSMTSYRFGVR